MKLEANHSRLMRTVPHTRPAQQSHRGPRACCGCRQFVKLLGESDLCQACLDALGERVRAELGTQSEED